MRITWHGHSCFEIKNAISLVIDPHDGKSIGIKPPVVRGDIVLVTHEHFDHNCVRIVKGDPAVVREPGEHMVKGLRITGLPTFHDHESGSRRGRNIIYSFVFDGIRICHCGDLGHMLSREQIRAIGQKGDIAWGMTTSGKSANVVKGLEAARKIGMVTIGLTGRDGGDVAKTADHVLNVASTSTPRIQEVHITAGHVICEMVDFKLFQRPDMK